MTQKPIHFLLPALLLLCFPLSAQPELNWNQWIQTDQDYIKIKVWEDGVYKIPFSELEDAGFDLLNSNTEHLQLFYRGEEVPIYIDQQLEEAFLEFVGFRNNGDIDSLLYYHPINGLYAGASLHPNPEFSTFTDTSTYFLTIGSQAGLRYTSYFQEDYENYSPATSFPFEVKLNFHPSDDQTSYVRGGGGQYDSFYTLNTDYVTGEGYNGPVVSYENPLSLQIETPGFVNQNENLRITTRWFGRSNTPHHLRIRINTDTIYENRFITSKIEMVQDQFQKSLELQDQNNVLIEALNPPTDNNHFNLLSIRYPRSTTLNYENTLRISAYQSDQIRYFQFEKIDALNNLWVYDPIARKRIQGIAAGIAQFSGKVILPANEIEADLFLSTDKAPPLPYLLEQAREDFGQLSADRVGVKYLIITHRNFTTSAQEYASYRSNHPARPLSSKVVFTDELYDEFGFGSYSPLAIINFISSARTHWQNKPKFILLLGKGGYQPRTDLITFVPASGYPASDHIYAQKRIPNSIGLNQDIAIGRLPITNNQQGLDYLEKLQQFELSPWEEWRRKGLFLGGGAGIGEHNAITDALTFYIDHFIQAPFLGEAIYYQRSTSNPIDSLKVIGELELGVGLLQTFGHYWNNIPDIPIPFSPTSLNQQSRFPFFIHYGIGGSDFTTDTPSLPEQWVLPKHHGAIAMLGHSSAGYLTPLRDYLRVFYEEFYNELVQNKTAIEIGEVIRSVVQEYTSTHLGIQPRNHARSMNLLGDPALVLYPEEAYTHQDDQVDVWPGDANYDGKVDMRDLLNWGLFVGKAGPRRADSTINWAAQIAADWDTTFTDTLVNLKHADMDGNGTIGFSDTLAIGKNYGLTHPFGVVPEEPEESISIELTYPAEINPGQIIQLNLQIPDNQPEEVYGMRFVLNFPYDGIALDSVGFDFSNSWLGIPGEELVVLSKLNPERNILEVGLTRTDGIPIIGSGNLMDIIIVISDDIARIKSNRSYIPFEVILEDGLVQLLNGEQKSIAPQFIDTFREAEQRFGLKLFPNPTSTYVVLQSNTKLQGSLSIFDLKGKTLRRENISFEGNLTIDIDDLDPGIYTLKLSGDDFIWIKKLVKI